MFIMCISVLSKWGSNIYLLPLQVFLRNQRNKNALYFSNINPPQCEYFSLCPRNIVFYYISFNIALLDLYKLICKTSKSESLLFEQIPFDELSVKTLLTDHKPCFNVDEWRKIVWFENHFSKSHETDDKDMKKF